MIKLITLIALLGLSQAQWFNRYYTLAGETGSGWTWPSSGSPNVVLNNQWVKITNFAEFDFGFGTKYAGSDMMTSDIRSEMYAAHLWSYGRHLAHINFRSMYSYDMELSIEPVYFAPYMQTIGWTRPQYGMTSYSL